jgi:hypothetical protein
VEISTRSSNLRPERSGTTHAGDRQEDNRSDEQGAWCQRPPPQLVSTETAPRQEEAYRQQDHPDHDPEAGKLSELPERRCEASR